MGIEEQIAWIIDPEAFSEETRQWMEANSRSHELCDQWRARRRAALKKARIVVAMTKSV